MSNVSELEQKAAALREILNAQTERELAVRELAEVETRIAEQRKMQQQDDAKARLVAIKRTYGSLRDAYVQDRARIVQRTRELSAAITTMNERWAKLIELELESRDLGKDFGLPTPVLELPRAPADLLRDATAETRFLNVDDYARMVRAHDHVREGPNRTRYDAARDLAVEQRTMQQFAAYK